MTSAPSPSAETGPSARQRVLHVGCGPKAPHRLHAVFRKEAAWQEIRLDLDPSVAPDIVCSTVDMRRFVVSASFDALWSSHNVEHLYDHEIPLAFSEFLRILRPGGFALIRCPDIQAVVETIHVSGIETIAYMSPAGPITPLDMLFGHRASIAHGNYYMAHRTAFTDERLARLLLDAGFAEVMTRRADGYDLWAVAFAPGGNPKPTLDAMAAAGLDFRT
jgi:SAM-dependent methyltransferase